MKRQLLFISIAIFVLFSNRFIHYTVANAWQPKPVELKGKHFEAGILLGGMSSYSKDSIGYFSEASDRFIQANKLYKQGIIKKIIVSGGRIEDDQPKEALFLEQQLLQNGVLATDIIREDQSKNTFENAVYTKKKIDSLQLKGPFVLITSATHMIRSEKIFSKAGIAVVPFPCNYTVFNSRLSIADFIWPNVKTLDEWRFILKEWVGIVVYKLTGKL